MNANDVMKMLEAGFTATEIRALVAANDPPAPEPEPAPEPAPEPEPAPAPAAPPEPVPAGPDPVLAAIEKLTGTITGFMNRSYGVDTPDEDPQTVAEKTLRAAFYGENKTK